MENTAQRFRIILTGDGSGALKILTGASGYEKCLAVQGASVNSGAMVVQLGYSYNVKMDNDH